MKYWSVYLIAKHHLVGKFGSHAVEFSANYSLPELPPVSDHLVSGAGGASNYRAREEKLGGAAFS